MVTNIDAGFKPFDETDTYVQDDVGGLEFWKVLPEGVVSDVDMGLVVGTGPLHKREGSHMDFHQIYLIFEGKGHVNIGGNRFRIDRPGIATIPCGTLHSIEVDSDSVMKYVYVNRKI